MNKELNSYSLDFLLVLLIAVSPLDWSVIID